MLKGAYQLILKLVKSDNATVVDVGDVLGDVYDPVNKVLKTSDQSGTDGTGIAHPTGGTGIKGWLSGIYNALVNALTVKAKPFTVEVQITRPTNTTPYVIGQLINAATATNALPALDFSGCAGYTGAGQAFEINSAIITSSNGTVTTTLAAQVALYLIPGMQANCADAQAFAPAYATLVANKNGRVDAIETAIKLGTNAYEIMQAEICRRGILDANGKIYAAILANNAYVPASGEILTLTVKGIFH